MKQRRRQPLDFDDFESKGTPLWQVIVLATACLIVIYIAASELCALLLMQAGSAP